MPLSHREMIAENPIAEVDNRSITEKCSDIEHQLRDIRTTMRRMKDMVERLMENMERAAREIQTRNGQTTYTHIQLPSSQIRPDPDRNAFPPYMDANAILPYHQRINE